MRESFTAALTVLLTGLLALSAGAGYPQYYAPQYYTPSYSYNYAPAIDYFNGQSYYHYAGYDEAGRHYPAGFYSWRNGNWYSSNGTPYYATTVKEAISLKQTVPYQAGWKEKLLSIASQRDRIEGRIREQSADFEAYLRGLKALGLEGNFRWPNYGQGGYGIQGGYGMSNYNSNRVAQGNTIYGYNYSFQTLRDVYGDSSPNVWMQQASRLTENAQQLAGQANSDYQGNIDRDLSRRGRVAEILATAQARKLALDASHPQVPTESHTEQRFEGGATGGASTGTGSGGTGKADAGGGQAGTDGRRADAQGGGASATGETADAKGGGANVSAHTFPAQALCTKCHGADKKEAGFDVRTYTKLSLEDKAKVWERLSPSAGDDKRMPRGGKPLTPEQFRQFVTH